MTLFGPEIISSISYNQEQIIRNIIHLHCPGGIECDATYSSGRFYSGAIRNPKYKFDLSPVSDDVVQADAGTLPLPDASLGSLMFDPPFVAGTHVESEEYVMGKRFTMFKNMVQLREMYSRSISEFARVLRTKGILIVKCQDTCHGRGNYFNHIYIHELAISCGFKPIDIFILLSKNRFIGNIQKQHHSRKFHCYFWVFKKSKV